LRSRLFPEPDPKKERFFSGRIIHCGEVVLQELVDEAIAIANALE
jgi:hypothetical protein